MTLRPSIREAMWMAIGAALFAGFIAVVAHSREGRDPASQMASRAARADAVTRMQLGLAAASEAEKSAVMAGTDREATAFADQARASAAGVEREIRTLDGLLKTSGTPGERELLGQFTKDFAEYQRVDGELLNLAVKGTNLKAYGLAFGPAAQAVEKMKAALLRVAAANENAPETKKITTLAFTAQTAVLRLQTLLPPHIAEESDQKMDAMEAVMEAEEAKVQAALDGLAAVPDLTGKADLAEAVAGYTEFGKIKAQILIFSRENTNVHSLAVSLNQKRKVVTLCQEVLDALRRAIEAEPIAGGPYGGEVRPRELEGNGK
ncbi:MAG: MCP four helix bundle domain-containing protein [Planctomycetes bacterium]|nr:MCP four helix bundle domain-containing protein [Planctomycetota bacterium]